MVKSHRGENRQFKIVRCEKTISRRWKRFGTMPGYFGTLDKSGLKGENNVDTEMAKLVHVSIKSNVFDS